MLIRKGTLPSQPRQRSSRRALHSEKERKEPQGKQSDVSNIECFNCHKMGHFAKDCTQPKIKFKRRFQASATKEEEPKKKKNAKSSKEDEPRREY